MKKHIVLLGMLLMGTSLQAGEDLVFYSVLSSPVGSFGKLETTTCSYPDLKGQSGGNMLNPNRQLVVNLGPTYQGGEILLKGGPVNVPTLLMEDGSELQTEQDLLFSREDSAAKLTIYPQGQVKTTGAILIENLILPSTAENQINITGTTHLVQSVKVNTFKGSGSIGEFNFVNIPEDNITGTVSFQSLPESNANDDNSGGFSGFLCGK